MTIILLLKLFMWHQVASPFFFFPAMRALTRRVFLSVVLVPRVWLSGKWASFVSLSAGRENVKLMFCVAVKDKRTHLCLPTLWFRQNLQNYLNIIHFYWIFLLFKSLNNAALLAVAPHGGQNALHVVGY